MSAKVYLVDKNVGLASFGNVQMSTFSGILEPEHVPVMRRIRTDLASAYPQGVVTLCVIMPECSIPGAVARQAVGELLEQITVSERAAAYVIEGKGIAGAAMRTMLSTLIMAARGKHASKVFENAADAGSWLAGHCAKLTPEVSLVGLNGASEELRKVVLSRASSSLSTLGSSPSPGPDGARGPTTLVR